MCKCLDGRVFKALDLSSDVHLHAWVRIPLLAITFFCLMIWKHALFMLKFAQVRFFSKFAYTSYNDLIKKSLGELKQSIPAYIKERLGYEFIKGTRGSLI